jgi:serine protease Do
MKSERIFISSLRLLIGIVLILSISYLLHSCSGCSQSGIRNRSDRNSNRAAESKYSRNEPVKTQPESNNQPTNSQLPLNELFKKYQSAVFMVYTTDGEKGYQGSGFFISSNGIAVSNYHVFEGTTRGLEVIKTYDGNELRVDKILTKSAEDDYIIFKVRITSTLKFNPIPIAKKNPDIGEDVFAIGNPHGLEHTLSKGIISGYRENDKLIQTTTEITHGSSGGPLLNMKGEVVGITTSGLGEANINFAVNINHLPLKKFL